MSKKAKIILIIIAVLFVAALIWFGKKNQKSIVEYDTETPFKTTIIKKTVATGKVTPLEEIEIKPQITGIIDKIMLLEGSKVKKGVFIGLSLLMGFGAASTWKSHIDSFYTSYLDYNEQHRDHVTLGYQADMNLQKEFIQENKLFVVGVFASSYVQITNYFEKC